MFLADSILADIIDYDEFLTGSRSEATYFMYKNFLPKIIMIPTSAIPLALMGVFGHKKPSAGRSVEQPTSVVLYIKVLLTVNVITALLAFALKLRYPLRERQIDELAVALKIHQRGSEASDPLTGESYYPVIASSDDEEHLFDLLGHFSSGRLTS